ncbi:Pyruvate dehydrogenase kinase, isoenzyme 2,related [Neospora caninum Liverpool]|uniref:Protein-serine/threonine kinase n=1 Tax=Neospora caninum (strain Liverpool) TaxID=572307 RepID=F0VPM2_NEOCL|nr:Pyruvate dehydrogenase kinase, isoenzyme 2,related [Neospora caninum Liverpool]CBZ55669.1 Pyruvate dehydrogenase kinase, isoenzyme 2,related [Neospora caninum Liverpool]|eukprot:XP_003885695.1 Pyruvate dehydrogenase kinase, isoenzyme 2,related [Neospora caninum Liverpool]
MAEITEFAMRPCRPLTLQEIAYLKGPRTPPPPAQSPAQNALLSSSEEAPPSSSTAFSGAGDGHSVELFLSVELPVRFATRIKQIEAVRQLYVESFKQLRMCTWTNKAEFAKLLKNLKRRHAPIAPLLVTGMRNLKRRFPDIFTDEFVDDFLDGFFLSRIGTEMLTSAYLSPSGIVDTDAERLCHYHYGCCPRVLIWNHERERFACVPQYLYYILFELFKNAMRATVERFGGDSSSRSTLSSSGGNFRLIRDFSRSCSSRSSPLSPFDELDEGLSSVRTARSPGGAFGPSGVREDEYDGSFVFYGRPPHYETKIADSDTKLPPIQVVVSGDNRVIAIKMSDQGGGVGQESIEKIWSYMYTTARPVEIGVSQSPPAFVAPADEVASSPPTVGSLDAAPPTIPGAALASPGLDAPACGDARDAARRRAFGFTSGDGRRSGDTGGSAWASGASDTPAAGSYTRRLCSGPHSPSLEKRAQLGKVERSGCGLSERELERTETDTGSPRDTGHTPAVGSASLPSSAGSPATPQVSPLAGFGCGLPLSRLYASYLGGRLEILSLPFHGSDAYLYLNRIGDKERMPPNSFPQGVAQAGRGELRTREELELLGLPRD